MSACLSVTRRGEAFEIVHELNGRRFVLPSPAYQLLRQLREPATLDELLVRTGPAFPAGEVQKLLDRLRAGGVVVMDGDDETFHQRLPAQAAMGIPFYEGGQPEDQNERRLVLLGLPYGGGNHLDAGCARFPAKFRWFAHAYLSNLQAKASTVDLRGFGADNAFFAPLRRWLTEGRLTDGGDLCLQASEFPVSVYAKVRRLASETAAAGNVPIFLGGDHSLTFPAIAGVASQHEHFQVIQFDAHTDTYANRVAELYAGAGKAAHHHGNFLSRVLELPQITSVWQFGIRGPYSLNPPADHRCQTVYTHEIPDFLNGHTSEMPDPDLPTYLTFDIDFFDPAVAPGTATPVIAGPGYQEGMQLLTRILDRVNIVAADIMEVNPEKDYDQRTIQVATNTLFRLINGIKDQVAAEN
jgi:agmatinase